MELKYTSIDLETATRDEIKAEIDRLNGIAAEKKNGEQAIKIFLNSCYGALGNPYLICYNADLAEAITLQGQNLYRVAEGAMEHYFHNIWHTDKELHDKLGITEVKPILKPMVIAGDTDSNYVTFGEVVDSCDWKGDAKTLILEINKHRLKTFLDTVFDRYAKKTDTANYQDFEMENISSQAVWTAKKHYVLNKVWEDGIDLEEGKNLKYAGIGLAKGSMPQFARNSFDNVIKYIFDTMKEKNISLGDMISLLKKMKAEFKLSDPEKITMTQSITDYGSYILNDSAAKPFEYAAKCPIGVRAAGYHNWLLNRNPKYKEKYEMIKSGDKIKWYKVKTQHASEEDVFAFLPNNYPVEFAPPIDYDMQFAEKVIDPINEVTMAMGLPEISSNLYISKALF